MSPVAYGTFSNQAVMFASILYALALLSHMAEWSIRRPRPAAVEAAPVRHRPPGYSFLWSGELRVPWCAWWWG